MITFSCLQAAIAMYGCARIGAVHSVVFGGFAPNELARRIDDAEVSANLIPLRRGMPVVHGCQWITHLAKYRGIVLLKGKICYG